MAVEGKLGYRTRCELVEGTRKPRNAYPSYATCPIELSQVQILLKIRKYWHIFNEWNIPLSK